MDRNSEKWSPKGYHSLLFAAKVSVWRSFERFHSLNNRHRNFPHHSIPSRHVSYTTERFFWPRVETRLLIALFFLPFGTPDSGSKFRRYQVFIRYHWASAGVTKGNRLPKRKRNVLRRDDYFYLHHYPFQICITDQAWGQHDWIYGQIPFFCISLDFLEVLYFFLVGYAKRLRRSFFHCRTSCIEARLRSLLRTYERLTCSKSSILFTERSRGQWEKNDANIQLSWPKKLDQ